MTITDAQETKRQERQAELLAQVRRQEAALLATVRRQTSASSAATVSAALPREEKDPPST